MDLTFRIIYIILIISALIIVNQTAKKFARIMNSRNLMERDIEMYKMNYSEQDILSHLEFIIDECLEYYVAINLAPKSLYYINNTTETEIVNKLGEIVPSRISPTLYSQLSLIYDSNQIASVIGEKIYLKVLGYVIEFNVQNEAKNKK